MLNIKISLHTEHLHMKHIMYIRYFEMFKHNVYYIWDI